MLDGAGEALVVLVVEDDRDYAEVVIRLLERNPELDVKVEHEESLAGALERLAADPPVDVVLLDLRLPDEAGLRTIQRAAEGAPGAAIIVMTAMREQQLGLEAIKLGAHEYVVKDDVTPQLLLRTVRYAYERRRLLEALRTAERESQRERELRKLERLSADARVSVTANLYGDSSVREHLAGRYVEMVGEYRRILDEALEERAYKGKPRVNEDLRSLASVLGVLRASPRDVVELHTGALRQVLTAVDPDRGQAYVEEGRVLVLELMGYLVAYYRARSVDAPRRPSATEGTST